MQYEAWARAYAWQYIVFLLMFTCEVLSYLGLGSFALGTKDLPSLHHFPRSVRAGP